MAHRILAAAVVAALIVLLGCEETIVSMGKGTTIGIREPEAEPDPEPAPRAEPVTLTQPVGDVLRYVGSGDHVFFLNPDGEPINGRSYTLDLGTAEDVNLYLLSTNTTTGHVTPRTSTDTDLSTGARQSAWRERLLMVSDVHGHDRAVAPPSVAAAVPVEELRQPTREGDTYVFRNVGRGEGRSDATATARRVVTDGQITFVLWVEDTEWGCATCYTQPMVDKMAKAFLEPGPDNDIYDWVTAVFGLPWGPHGDSLLIPASYANEVHMLLANIGPSGYFSASNKYLRRWVPNSAERLMFYIASRTTPNRKKTMSWTLVLIDAMTHEFQHIVFDYQQGVLHGSYSGWLNEMASTVAEELVARKFQDHGLDVRGCLPGVWTQDYEVTGRGTYYNVLCSLGIYLALNYGGVPIMRDIVQNEHEGEAAIEAALDAHGYDAVTFEDVLMNWAVATLLHDNEVAPLPYRYNAGPWSESEGGGLTFRIAPVKMYLHSRRMFSIAEFNAKGAQPPHSNRFAYAEDVTDAVQFRVDAALGNRITVVVKQT